MSLTLYNLICDILLENENIMNLNMVTLNQHYNIVNVIRSAVIRTIKAKTKNIKTLKIYVHMINHSLSYIL